MEEKRKRLNQAVDWLLYKHMAGSISEIAEKAGVNRSHFSSVLKGNGKPVTDGMLLKLCAAYTKLDFEWLSEGKGNPLVRQDVSISGKNIVNGNATNSIVGDFHDLSVQMPNKYGDSPSEERKWAPVVPQSMAAMPDFDIMGHITKQMAGGNIEKLYSGTLDIDAWYYIPDSDIEDYCKGDCLGIKAYPQGEEHIVPGKLYVIDTRLNGMLVRYLWKIGDGYAAATSKDGTRNRFDIAGDDVIRIYRKLIMFRY